MKKLLVLSAAALAISGGSALADIMATAGTNLNVRAGPGSNYPVVGTLGAGQAIGIDGCLNAGRWCRLSSGEGWVSSRFLGSAVQGAPVVAYEGGSTTVVQPRGTDSAATGAITGGAAGAITGGVLGGPAGAAIGGVAGFVGGGAVGTALNPPAHVRTYVTSHRIRPVEMRSGVTVGATLPAGVELGTIPDYQYRYAYVGDQPVLVEPGSRRIVYMY
jgi:Protein of unknown function (DUF1236)/Bacterial SH3 domain